MNNIIVEHNIPLPDKAGRVGRPTKYPWAELSVGDSFFVPLNSMPRDAGKNWMTIAQLRGQMSNLAHRYGQRHKKKFATRKRVVKTGNVGRNTAGVRVWRIK